MKYTNSYKLPESFNYLLSTLHEDYDIDPKDLKTISATALQMPARLRTLLIRHYNEIKKDITDELWSLFGTSVHYSLHRLESNERFIVEKRLEHKLDGIKISGKFDIFDTETKTIQDLKITSVWSYILGKPEWEKQLNVYAYLMRKVMKIEPKKLQIIAILKDWNKRDSLRYHDYPEIPFGVLTLRLWFESEQEKYIRDRIKIHLEALNSDDDNLPECSPEERWRQKTKYAIMKNRNKTATRVFEDKKQAEEFIRIKLEKDKKNKYHIVERMGIDRRCINYCPVKDFCNYYKEHYGD